MFTELLLAVSAVVAFYLYSRSRRPQGFPPGPNGVPVLGYLPFLTNEPEQKFRQLGETYGDIIGLIIGNKKAVVLNGTDVIRDAYKEEVFSGRPKMDLLNMRSDGEFKGIAFNTGRDWHEQRRFTLRHLRDFGFGKKSLESVIEQEISSLTQGFRKEIGKPVQLNLRFNLAVVNTLWNLIASKRFEHDDPMFLNFFKKFHNFMEKANFIGPFLFAPWLAKLLPNSMTGIDSVLEVFKDFRRQLDAEIEEHAKTLDKDNLRDLIDVYLVEISKTTDATSGFYQSEGYLSLSIVALDLFIGGSETTGSTLEWALMMLLKHPHMKTKIVQEIESVVGSHRMVTLADRSSMPYTEATVLETLRYSSIVPLSLPHEATEDKEFRGYKIPKGSIIIGNLLSSQFDPKKWDEPQNFQPERFLTPDGRLKRSEALMPFASGKRVCIGERLAQDETFLFLTNILQQLDVSLPPGEHIPKKEYRPGSGRMPAKYTIVFNERIHS